MEHRFGTRMIHEKKCEWNWVVLIVFHCLGTLVTVLL